MIRMIKVSALMLVVITAVAACSNAVIDRRFELQSNQSVVLMPITNLGQTPQAGEIAEAIFESLWLQRQLPKLEVYPRRAAYTEELPPLNDQRRFDNAKAWLAQQSADYYVTGTVTEWRYKSGLDGEPAVGLSLKIYDAHTDVLVWSASSARSGWDRESLSAAAQKVIAQQLDKIKVAK